MNIEDTADKVKLKSGKWRPKFRREKWGSYVRDVEDRLKTYHIYLHLDHFISAPVEAWSHIRGMLECQIMKLSTQRIESGNTLTSNRDNDNERICKEVKDFIRGYGYNQYMRGIVIKQKPQPFWRPAKKEEHIGKGGEN